MVLDNLANSARYESLNSRFAKAFAWLRTMNGKEELGRHDIDGDHCFALVQTYESKSIEKAKFEAHRKYIDIQFIHSGRETILWAPLDTMKEETMAYSDEKDAALWKLTADTTPLHVSAGHFAILWPQDAHAPCIEWDKPEQVFKVVIKVAVE